MIIFENPGEIDLRSISTFGISVKEGDNPIGFFGTGLKYAIAVLLRTGHQVEIHSGLQVVKFSTHTDAVRGKDFEFITMALDGGQPSPLGFTTELGKQWELWMAYREIACNCKDEKGEGRFAQSLPAPAKGTTRIAVRGQDFEGVFADSHMYLLADKPSLTIGATEIRNRRGRALFYRGVRVMELQKPGLYTYNLNSKLTLTEDRTVRSTWDVGHRIAQAVLESDNERFVRDAITASEDFYESELDFHGYGIAPSQQFLDTVGEALSSHMVKVNQSAMRVWRETTKQSLAPREVTLSKVQLMSLNRAIEFCERLGYPVRAYPIKVVEALADGTLGLAMDETIWLSERTFELGGAKQLASTLIEEFLHLRHGWRDCTRELQSYLFEKLVSLGEELAGEPL